MPLFNSRTTAPPLFFLSFQTSHDRPPATASTQNKGTAPIMAGSEGCGNEGDEDGTDGRAFCVFVEDDDFETTGPFEPARVLRRRRG